MPDMELNYVAKGIKLIGTSIVRLDISNSLVDLDTEAKKAFGFSVHKPKKELLETGYYYSVVISIQIKIEKDNSGEADITMDLEGAFEPEPGIDEDEFGKLVAINGVAALVSIARGKIEAISATVLNTGKITIPFVNVVEYYDTIKKEKDKKNKQPVKNE